LVGHFIASIDRRQADRNGFQSIPVTKETALHIGQEIENLADAIDAGDSTALTIVVSRLRKAANRFGAAPIEAVAQRIEQSSGAQTNDGGGRTMALELLELCRSTQRAWITEDRGHEQSAP
jgi:HPt (histidine-containing phosphotransfer) domain-containing protein